MSWAPFPPPSVFVHQVYDREGLSSTHAALTVQAPVPHHQQHPLFSQQPQQTGQLGGHPSLTHSQHPHHLPPHLSSLHSQPPPHPSQITPPQLHQQQQHPPPHTPTEWDHGQGNVAVGDGGSSHGSEGKAGGTAGKKKRKRCGDCPGCLKKENCGNCGPCRSVRSHQICKLRKCDSLKTKKERAREASQTASVTTPSLSGNSQTSSSMMSPNSNSMTPPSVNHLHQPTQHVLHHHTISSLLMTPTKDANCNDNAGLPNGKIIDDRGQGQQISKVYIHDAFQLHLQGGQQHALPSFDHSFKSNESNGINEKVGARNFSSDHDNRHHLNLQHNHQSVQLKPSHMVNGNGEVFSPHHHQHNNGSNSGNNGHGNHQSISNGDGKSGVNGNSSDDDVASRRQLTNNRLKTLIQNRQQTNKHSPDLNSNNGPANTSPQQVTDSAQQQHQLSHPHPSPQPQLTELRNAAPILTPPNQYNTAQPVYTNQLQDPGYDYIDWSGILSYI